MTLEHDIMHKSLSGVEDTCTGMGAPMDVDDIGPTTSRLVIHIPCALVSSCMQTIADVQSDKTYQVDGLLDWRMWSDAFCWSHLEIRHSVCLQNMARKVPPLFFHAQSWRA